MARKRKERKVSDYCLQHNVPTYQFFEELKKYSSYCERLHTDENGEYVIDEESLKYVVQQIRLRQEKAVKRKSRPADRTVVAVATEINSLAADNERLAKELRRVTLENKRLREIIECREKNRRKKIEVSNG